MLSPRIVFVLPAFALVACVSSPDDPNDLDDVRPGMIHGWTVADATTLVDAATSGDAATAPDAPGEPDPDPPPAPPGDLCAVPSVESWSGTASRDNTIGYPDNINATVTWTRVGTSGCVDSYTPTGTAEYRHAIPGAQCAQSISPTHHPIASGDGTLTIDRTTSPPTFTGRGATLWPITFRCVLADGTVEESPMDGGAIWFDMAGTVTAGAISGSDDVEEDASRCGPNGIAPCTYAWSFTAN